MGTLYIVATPIGNLEDISLRAIRTLFSVDIIACEDTRRAGLLLSELTKRYASVVSNTSSETPALHLGGAKLMRYDDHTEQNLTPELLELLKAGKSIALISDAGTPLISDPGYILVREAKRKGVPIVSIPGPSALLTALTSSGLPADKFMFLGYPPEKQSHRLKLFSFLFQCFKTSEQHQTIIFYCAPHKLKATLEDLKEICGDISITICRELTKIHEECWTGTITEALIRNETFKGELVLLLSTEGV